MQSLWNEQAVLIDADHVTLLGPGPAPGARRSYPHEGDPARALAVLLGDVSRTRLRWRNRLTVWLGYPWFHAKLLAWQPGLPGGDSHWRRYAQAMLRERGIAGDFRVRLGPARHGQPRLAFAADAAMLDAVARQAGEQGWTLAACRDLLSASLERYRRPLREPGRALVLAEPAAMTCLWQSAQGWDDMITLRLASGQSASAGIVAAETLCGRAAPAQYYWASTLGPQQLPVPAQAQWLGFPHPLLAAQSCRA